jgi:hypothetical protein
MEEALKILDLLEWKRRGVARLIVFKCIGRSIPEIVVHLPSGCPSSLGGLSVFDRAHASRVMDVIFHFQFKL